MTLLSICQAVCDIAPVAAPTSIVGNSDQTAVTLLALANVAGQGLARRPQGGWVASIREYDFQTNALEPQSGTIENSGGVAVITNLTSTTGIAADTWVASGTNVLSNSTVTSFTATSATLSLPATDDTLTAGTFSFGQADYTLPADFQRAIDNTFWDRTRYWQMRGPLSPQQWQMFKSSLIGSASVQRRYRFRRISGAQRLSIDPTPFDDASRLVFEYVSNAYCETAAGVAQTSWQADDDVGVLDEYLIQLGLQYRFLRRLGLSYSDEMAEYEREVSKAIANDGASPTLSLVASGSLALLGPANLPEGYYPSGGSDGSGGFIIGVSGIGVGGI